MPTNIQQEVRRTLGFDVLVLRNDAVELAVVPELGAKVVSLKNVRSGREWMWSRDAKRRLFRNALQDDFTQSTLLGWDECLPTIAPCQWNGRKLPDHGEAWCVPWRVDSEGHGNGRITTKLDLPISPLTFARTLRLDGNTVVADYTLTNKASGLERFIWAMHPLLALEKGDELDVPETIRTALTGETWVPTLTFPKQPACAKAFVQVEGLRAPVPAGVINRLTGDRITFEWSPPENDTLGLWLTRGGWHGHHHFAIEPTNARNDSLAKAAGELNHCGAIAPGQTLSWTVRIHIDSCS